MDDQSNATTQPVAAATTEDKPVDATAPAAANSDLGSVKQKAMAALVPLLDSIQDLSPERKFDICLSAIRLTDNRDLAATALDAALAIQEDGTKAEALVELINEIDYLTNN